MRRRKKKQKMKKIPFSNYFFEHKKRKKKSITLHYRRMQKALSIFINQNQLEKRNTQL